MNVVLQRVSSAGVSVDGRKIAGIGRGFLILLGISDQDTEQTVEKMADKIRKLRIFTDENGKTNLSLADVNGELLVVSQFTLYADCRKGNRPSFIGAGAPDHAKKLYRYCIECFRGMGIPTQHGSFGAEMNVELSNDGPFTLVLDSSVLFG